MLNLRIFITLRWIQDDGFIAGMVFVLTDRKKLDRGTIGTWR